ncbi:hypothetical protein [Mucilaginibacter sp. CSA2-8R]|uniref:hypothetical protein n=1 Tax=Mucilaginibacter sp. CSA2-8R TaxID=3141542 RepID=UPI00315D1047
MTIQTANSLFDNGTLADLYKAGFLSEKIFLYREIYLWINAQIFARGISKNRAVFEAQEFFDRDQRTIWRALNNFEDEEVLS